MANTAIEIADMVTILKSLFISNNRLRGERLYCAAKKGALREKSYLHQLLGPHAQAWKQTLVVVDPYNIDVFAFN